MFKVNNFDGYVTIYNSNIINKGIIFSRQRQFYLFCGVVSHEKREKKNLISKNLPTNLQRSGRREGKGKGKRETSSVRRSKTSASRFGLNFLFDDSAIVAFFDFPLGLLDFTKSVLAAEGGKKAKESRQKK